MTIPLSVLDLATVASDSSPSRALRETSDMAQVVERLGFERLWVAEHHAMPSVASSAPAVLIAHLASQTTTLRVGSGGVMLANHSPLVIAEQFATLEALHPGRIDLGLGRAPGTDPRTARALRRASDVGAENFPNDVVELIGYLVPRHGAATPAPAATPGSGYLPEVWLLGSSTFSAQLAGVLGLPFSFAYHFAPALLDSALSTYRSSFTPSSLLAHPRVMVAASLICAPTRDEATWLAGSTALSILQRRSGRLELLPSPSDAASYSFSDAERAVVREAMTTHIIGDPHDVRAGLAELAARTNADELMISTRTHSFDDRVRSFSLLAAAWGVGE